MSEYQIDDVACPACNNHYTHSRYCDGMYCDDGYIDEHEDDPINFARGESIVVCPDCHGHGVERWCPKCGADYWMVKTDATQESD